MPDHLPDLLRRNLALAAVAAGGLACSFLLYRLATDQYWLAAHAAAPEAAPPPLYPWLLFALGICITLMAGLVVVLYWRHRHARMLLASQHAALRDNSRRHDELRQEMQRLRERQQEIVHDRTASLLEAKNLAERASQAKTEFLANMSHELRTPMHAVLSFARIGHAKVGEVPPEKLKGYFDNIRTSGERLLDLVNDLLDLSRIEAGRMQYTMASCDLRACVEDVVAELKSLLATKQLICTVHAEADNCRLTGDYVRLTQVVRNLLGNAIKFTPEGRQIHLEIAEATLPAGRRASDVGEQSALRLTLTDEGVGIPEDELEQIFEKFTQSSRTNRGAGGAGLGLAVCREIVQAHGGTIRARNCPAGGAQFEVLLPRQREIAA